MIQRDRYHAVAAIVFAQYWLVTFDLPITAASQTGVAIAVTTVTSLSEFIN